MSEGKKDPVTGDSESPQFSDRDVLRGEDLDHFIAYLDTSDREVLSDLADFSGGPKELLVPAWTCLELPLQHLPANLAARLRAAPLTSAPAACIPGGSRRYMEILAAQVDSRRGLLEAVARPAASDAEAAAQLAAGAKALIDWWQVHLCHLPENGIS